MSTSVQQVTVPGTTGQVGRVVVPEAMRAGYRVRVLARSPDKLGAVPADVDVVEGGPARRVRACGSAAGKPGGDQRRGGVKDPDQFTKFERIGGNLLAEMREQGVRRLVNISGAIAIKFCGKGGRVNVTHRVTDDKVEIRVSDNGPGIAPEFQERIFEPFTQVDQGYTQTQGGTGLGLAISRELAQGMGGDLSVESEIGHGSTFILTFPRGRE